MFGVVDISAADCSKPQLWRGEVNGGRTPWRLLRYRFCIQVSHIVHITPGNATFHLHWMLFQNEKKKAVSGNTPESMQKKGWYFEHSRLHCGNTAEDIFRHCGNTAVD